nr:GAF domain-containing protein [Deinococcus aestuarii]
MAATHSTEDVFRVVLKPALEAVGAVAGAVLLVDGTRERLETVAAVGYEAGARTPWQDGPLGGHGPAGDALARREPLFFEQAGDLVRASHSGEARTGRVAAGATAVLPMLLDDRPLGVIVLDFGEPHEFTTEEQRFLRTLAAQCALALGRVRLSRDLERRTAELEEERTALAAFARFTEASTHLVDARALVGQAGAVLRDLLGVHVGYSALEDGRWKGEVFSEDTPPPVVEAARAGFPADLPSFARPFVERDVVFVEGWNGEQEGAEVTGVYTAAALYPYFQEGQPHGLLTMGSLRASAWTERERRVFRAVGRSLALAFERAEHARQVEADARAHEAFMAFTEAVGTETDLLTLARQAIAVLRARFQDGSIGYYTQDSGLWKAQAWSEDMSGALLGSLRAGLPGSTPLIHQVLQAGTAVFTDAWDPEREAFEHTQAYGTAAAYPLVVNGEVGHLLLFGLKDTWRWSERDRAVVRAVGRGLTLALDRAEQTRHLEEERAAQEAFVSFTEASSTETDVLALAHQATRVLRARFADASVGYYEPEGERWKARVWSEDVRADVLALMLAGLSADTPMFRTVLERRQVVFTDAWDPAREELEPTEQYGTVANAPLLVGGKVRGVLSIGLKDTRQWRESDQALFRAVARGLNLALERAEQTRRLAEQNAELDARTRVLSGFAELSHDLVLETDPLVLIRRTQEVVLGLLSAGYSMYFEPEGGWWRLKSQVGRAPSPSVQAVLDERYPFEAATNLVIPYQRGEVHYQDEYDPGTD